MNGFVIRILWRQKPPRRTGMQEPKNGFENFACGHGLSSPTSFGDVFFREEFLNFPPVFFSDSNQVGQAGHGLDCTQIIPKFQLRDRFLFDRDSCRPCGNLRRCCRSVPNSSGLLCHRLRQCALFLQKCGGNRFSCLRRILQNVEGLDDSQLFEKMSPDAFGRIAAVSTRAHFLYFRMPYLKMDGGIWRSLVRRSLVSGLGFGVGMAATIIALTGFSRDGVLYAATCAVGVVVGWILLGRLVDWASRLMQETVWGRSFVGLMLGVSCYVVFYLLISNLSFPDIPSAAAMVAVGGWISVALGLRVE